MFRSVPGASVLLVPVLVAGLVGCGGSKKSNRGASAAPTTSSNPSGVTSGGSGGGIAPTTTQPTAALPIPPSPPSQGNGLDAFNAELQIVWDEVRPLVLQELHTLASAQLAGRRIVASGASIDIINVNAVRAQAAVAPGFTRLDTGGAALRVPRQGVWVVSLDADVRVQASGITLNLPITLEVYDLTMTVDMDLDQTDPTRPVIQRVGNPQFQYQVRLVSNNALLQTLLGVLNPIAAQLAQQGVTLALQQLLPALNGLQGLPGGVPADGAAPYTDSGVLTPLAEVADNVDRKIRRDHMPHGTLLSTEMDQPNVSSWMASFRTGGPGTVGNVIGYADATDSATYTGQYLASQAFRYAVTNDPAALANVQHALGGIGALIDVNGGSGLLAQVAAPQTSRVGQDITTLGVFRQATINGQSWVGHQGPKGITRDAYAAVLFGLSSAYEHVGDPQVRAACQLRVEQLLDYLIANDWVIDEDRPVWTLANGNAPTWWAGVSHQKLAFLLIGYRINPAKYAQQVALAGPLAETAWVGLWTGTFGPQGYTKFNATHLSLHEYYRIETDAQRLQDMTRAYRMVERYVGHHRNPQFDLIQTSIDPSTRAALWPSSKEALRRFVQRPHRQVGPASVSLQGVTYAPVTVLTMSTGQGGFPLFTRSTVNFPTEPLDIPIRQTAPFLWDRDPFTAAQANAGNARLESPGVDMTLPWWMGLQQGAF